MKNVVKEVSAGKLVKFNGRKICLSEVIGEENVKYFGEMMAICAMKGFMGHSSGERFDKLYKGLLFDISNQNNQGHTFSDGYEFAQEAIVFLCGHYGKRLNDLLYVDKKGKQISVKKACLRVVCRLISKAFSKCRNHVNIDDLHHLEATETVEMVFESEYCTVDSIIETLGLNDKQKITLECRMGGMSYPETSGLLSISQGTIGDRLAKIRKLYVATYGEPVFRQSVRN
jgi:DNA-binding CsgD family transcriptional regulator